jgi:hypothetical protein
MKFALSSTPLHHFIKRQNIQDCKDVQIPSKHNKIYYTLPLPDYMFRLLNTGLQFIVTEGDIKAARLPRTQEFSNQ